MVVAGAKETRKGRPWMPLTVELCKLCAYLAESSIRS